MSVVCGDVLRDGVKPSSILNPVILVEVLSDSTESYDRGEKFENYRELPTLREYVLVSHREQLIEVFRRSGDGTWIRSETRSGAVAQLDSVGCVLQVDRIYRGVVLQGT